MVPLTELWLPILLSAVIVFVASSIMHMVLPYHRGDYKQLPDEQRVLDSMRSAGVRPGSYAFPFCPTPKEMGQPAMVEKYKRGPVGMLTVMPSGPPAMPKYLAMWFLYSVVISFFLAYLAGRTLASGAAYLQVFRVVGTAGFLGYAAAHASDLIWRGQSWSMTLKQLIDGLVYALLTAGVFGWLWPR
jgi:hypothetical protein